MTNSPGLHTPARSRALLRLLPALVVALFVAVLGAAPANAAGRPNVNWQSGVFNGFGPAPDITFGNWRGLSVQTGTDYVSASTWSLIENPAWDLAAWHGSTVRPVLSLQVGPPGSSMAQAATGAYNSHYVALAKNLVAAGLGNAILRFDWEFNGTWYPWSVKTAADAANFAAGWRQIVGAMKTVPGANFGFDWCVAGASSGVDPALAYPGDAYVTTIGMDVYDWNWVPGQTAAQRWNGLVNAPYGLQWQANFAAQHGKQVSFAEWGLTYSPYYPAYSGGDDPTFVQNMYNWFGSHNTAFEDYFNADEPSSGQYYSMTDGYNLFPQASALYKQLW
jgi:hypothetical protein